MANISLKVKTCIEQEKSEPKVKTEQPKYNNAVYTTDLVALECTQQLGSKTSTVQLEKGPDQFLVAHFSNGTHVTELSNLILAAALAIKLSQQVANDPESMPRELASMQDEDALIQFAAADEGSIWL